MKYTIYTIYALDQEGKIIADITNLDKDLLIFWIDGFFEHLPNCEEVKIEKVG